MSTASNQHQRGGRRQPFGFLNANTLPSAAATAKAGSGSDGSVGNAGSSDPVKSESKKKTHCVLSSIVTRSEKKDDRANHEHDTSCALSGGGSSCDEVTALSMLESPTKKIRLMTMKQDEDSKPSVQANTTSDDSDAVKMPSLQSQTQECTESNNDESTNNSVDTPTSSSIFRQPPDANFWNDEMEDMLELKQAGPIMDDSVDFGGEEEQIPSKVDHSYALTKDLNEDASGEPISWSNRLQEDQEDGFKIHCDP